MDSKQIEFYEKIIDALEVRKELESVFYILKSKTLSRSLYNHECKELGIDETGILAAVLGYYKKFVLENKKTP